VRSKSAFGIEAGKWGAASHGKWYGFRSRHGSRCKDGDIVSSVPAASRLMLSSLRSDDDQIMAPVGWGCHDSRHCQHINAETWRRHGDCLEAPRFCGREQQQRQHGHRDDHEHPSPRRQRRPQPARLRVLLSDDPHVLSNRRMVLADLPHVVAPGRASTTGPTQPLVIAKRPRQRGVQIKRLFLQSASAIASNMNGTTMIARCTMWSSTLMPTAQPRRHRHYRRQPAQSR
jgi:hypothetical protein